MIDREVSVPQFERSKFVEGSKEYNEFFSKNRKFAKPYSELTKYVDSLQKNHALLRRGAF
jgi:hypothetical protein